MSGESPEQRVINRIAEVAAAVGWQSGEPAMEYAGLIVSVLHANPEHTARFMAEGTELTIDGTIKAESGSLTYRAGHGGIMSPAELRAAKGMQDQ